MHRADTFIHTCPPEPARPAVEPLPDLTGDRPAMDRAVGLFITLTAFGWFAVAIWAVGLDVPEQVGWAAGGTVMLLAAAVAWARGALGALRHPAAKDGGH